MTKLLFSTFDVARQVFYQTPLSLAIVNLKPLLPGHVLVLPRRVTPRLTELTPEEVSDLFLSVQTVGRVLEVVYKAQALTVSLQDGKVAGQSVPHVHIHIIPRRSTDFEGDNDKIYPALEENEQELQDHLTGALNADAGEAKLGGKGKATLTEMKDEDRHPRSEGEMAREAEWLRSFFDKDS